MPQSGLIIANGEMPALPILRPLVAAAGAIFCADGGANAARSLGIRPVAIVGDLDSVLPETLAHFADVPVHEDHDEDSTDLEKTILFALRTACEDLTVVGALGHRLDHIAGNLGVLAKFHGRAKLRFIDDEGELTYIGRQTTFEARPGDVVSLVPIVRCEGVSTTGLRYPLNGEVLQLGLREGTSNVVVASPVTVQVERGDLLLYRLLRPRAT
jgi:thiamine pyrophosphokinase